MLQSMIANALVSVVLQSIETRYGLSSTQTGFVAASYEIASTLTMILIISKLKSFSPMKCISMGAVIISIGCLVFCVPQVLSDNYDPNDNSKKGLNDNIWLWFVMGMMVVGVGAIPASVFSYTYFDENVERKKAPIYHGIFAIGAFFGPFIGFIFGGYILKTPVDYYSRENSSYQIGLETDDPSFVGAWWLPFVISSASLLVVSVFVWPFPRTLKNSWKSTNGIKLQENGENTTNENNSSKKQNLSMQNMSLYKKILTKNSTFNYTNMAFICDAFVVQALIAFTIKLHITLFDKSPAEAGVGIALICTAGMIGQVIGAVGLSKLDSSIGTILKYAVISPVVGAVLSFGFMFGCHTKQFIGSPESTDDIFEYFGNTDNFGVFEIPAGYNSTCLIESSCESDVCNVVNYSPVCDTSSNVHYFHECFTECLNSTHKAQFLVSGECELSKSCPNSKSQYNLFLIFICLMFFFKALTATPVINVLMRCVDFNERNDALALSSTLVRFFGSIPGPIIVGKLIDTVCILWSENELCEKQNCVSYSAFKKNSSGSEIWSFLRLFE